jgi:hypothetical protein
VEFRFPADGSALRLVVARKFELFGSDNGSVDPYDVAPEGTAKLLGRRVGQVEQVQGITVRIDDPQLYTNVDPTASLLPTLVTGRVAGQLPTATPVRLAVTTNGRITAVTRSHLDADGEVVFQVLLPPSALRAGSNELQLLLVEGAPGSPELRVLAQDPA